MITKETALSILLGLFVISLMLSSYLFAENMNNRKSNKYLIIAMFSGGGVSGTIFLILTAFFTEILALLK